jgi:pimeloyl-ACP methyl ester carboxylesterase
VNDLATTATDLFKLGGKIAELYTRRVFNAQNSFFSQAQTATTQALTATPASKPEDAWRAWSAYATDWPQRCVLFWDTLRQRGNNFLEHERAGNPPLLAYDYETIVDGRKLARPVNYALVRIIPPPGVAVDEKKRPFIIVEPRAGHGPGVGAFKQDSQVGVALKAGHPVYFVIFFTRPEPGQTLPDVCEAEAQFVRTVAERHPDSPKPAVVGNCQGGWATMLLAASHPDVMGPVVINGAPMSYWSGNWHGGEGENPMRYLGGLLGGSWVALLATDLGNGTVDGANFVANFERLNPANNLWSKYYHLFANADTEPDRFLPFERWWGGYFLMNEAEYRWILDNLFIGNRLARGEARAGPHRLIDLKAIRSPIIIFSSAGDNITPPQQALNWIADVYASTEEIKANGQVIVGLLHPDVGHLGVFVSGRVAKKEYTQIVEVLEHIEALRPGLYLMEIQEAKGADGSSKYEVTIEERRLEDLRRANKFERKDEKPFEVVAEVSALGEKAYILFARPFVRPLVNEGTAELGRVFHPLRWQRWAFSDLNPMLWPLSAMASAVKDCRQPAPPDNPYRRMEKAASDVITAGLDLYRDLRDATMEAMFFQIYGPAAILGMGLGAIPETPPAATDPRELPLVRDALAAIGKGGYPEALALIGSLLSRGAWRFPLARLELLDRFIRGDEELSRLPADVVRRIKAEQAVIAELEPERGLESLPRLLADPADRQRVLRVLDEAVAAVEPTVEQKAMLARIRHVLGAAVEVNGKLREPVGAT